MRLAEVQGVEPGNEVTRDTGIGAWERGHRSLLLTATPHVPEAPLREWRQ